MGPTGSRIILETDGQSVVEGKANGDAGQPSFSKAVEEVGAGSMLGYRLEQQAALSNFGMKALKSHSIDEILAAAADTAAAGMRSQTFQGSAISPRGSKSC